MTVVKLIDVGDEVGVILPDEVLARLKLGLGDTVYVADARVGVMLTTQEQDVGEQRPGPLSSS
jgi:hypothetical protein